MRKSRVVVAAIFAILLTSVMALAVLGMVKPDDLRVERSIEIQAPPNRVWALIQDYRQWKQWSPWSAEDPEMKIEYSDPSFGVGALMSWHSDSQGSGTQKVVEAVPMSRMVSSLEFTAPFEDQAESDFTINQPSEGITQLVWGMTCKDRKLWVKMFDVILNMESVLGAQFEQGLQKIKTLAETP